MTREQPGRLRRPAPVKLLRDGARYPARWRPWNLADSQLAQQPRELPGGRPGRQLERATDIGEQRADDTQLSLGTASKAHPALGKKIAGPSFSAGREGKNRPIRPRLCTRCAQFGMVAPAMPRVIAVMRQRRIELALAKAATAAVVWMWSIGVGAEVISEQLSTLRADGSKIAAMVVRPDAASRLPILMYIDGSMCIPSMLGESAKYLRDGVQRKRPRYALVVVEKPSPTQPRADSDGGYSIGPEFTCSSDFKTYYSIDDRTTDHLRVIAALRKHAPWWNGRLLLWGHSDGARIAARLAVYVPETLRVVLGGMGGGRPMATDLEDVHICAAGRTDDRPKCIEELRKQFVSMRSEPSPSRTWNGDSNTWKAWASRLDAVETNILVDATAPMRMYHGAIDGSNPVESARLLARELKAAGGPPIELVEVSGMGHGLGAGLDAGTGAKLHRDFLDWLLVGSIRSGHRAQTNTNAD